MIELDHDAKPGGFANNVTTMRIRESVLMGLAHLHRHIHTKHFYSTCVLSSVAGLLYIVLRKRLGVARDAFVVNKS